VNWQVGQLTLKKAATTGPFFNASARADFFPFVLGSSNAGALAPADNGAILRPPRNS
jgi:hypothetical protein